MIEFYRASLAENVERCEARRAELTRQVQDLLREMEVVENLGFEVSSGSKEPLGPISSSFGLISVDFGRFRVIFSGFPLVFALLESRTGIEKLRESFLGRGQDVVDEELLRQACLHRVPCCLATRITCYRLYRLYVVHNYMCNFAIYPYY